VPRLKQLNYIFFEKPHSFVSSLVAVTTALRTDLDCVREYTRLGEAALRWQERRRSDALLLRGEEVVAAKAWLKAQPHYAPEPPLLTHEYIKGQRGRRSRMRERSPPSAERARAPASGGGGSASTYGTTAEACAVGFGSNCYISLHRLKRADANRRCLLAVQSQSHAPSTYSGPRQMGSFEFRGEDFLVAKHSSRLGTASNTSPAQESGLPPRVQKIELS
jgi:hypothetical protein